MDANYQNPIHLAVIIEGQLATDRPSALICPTSNPGDKNEHYNCLVFRVYSDKNDLNSFKGYLTFRYNEVYRKKKTQALPTFSSIEIRDSDFNSYVPPKKVHFDINKFMTDFPTQGAMLVVQASQAGGTSVEQLARLGQLVGESALKHLYPMLLNLIDGK